MWTLFFTARPDDESSQTHPVTYHKGILTQQWWKLWQASVGSKKSLKLSFTSVVTSVAKKSVKEIFTPFQVFAPKKEIINNDTCQDVEPLLQNYKNYSWLTWLQNLLGEQMQKTPQSKIRVKPAVFQLLILTSPQLCAAAHCDNEVVLELLCKTDRYTKSRTERLL